MGRHVGSAWEHYANKWAVCSLCIVNTVASRLLRISCFVGRHVVGGGLPDNNISQKVSSGVLLHDKHNISENFFLPDRCSPAFFYIFENRFLPDGWWTLFLDFWEFLSTWWVLTHHTSHPRISCVRDRVRICTYVCKCTYVHMFICLNMYVYIHMCVSMLIQMWICMYMHKYVNVWPHIRTHKPHRHTHRRIPTHS